jgi:hypothetical protein
VRAARPGLLGFADVETLVGVDVAARYGGKPGVGDDKVAHPDRTTERPWR